MEMHVIIFMTLALQAFLLLFTRRKTSMIKKHYKLPPGPTPLPIIGSMPTMLSNKPTFRWIHHIMKELNTDIACIRIGSTHIIPVSCPILAQDIMRKQDSLFATRPTSFAAETLSGGYLTAIFSPHGDQWKKMRRILTNEIVGPATHKLLHDKRAEESDHLVKYIYNNIVSLKQNNVFNLRQVARHYTTNVARRLMFNKRYFGNNIPLSDEGFILATDDEEAHVKSIFQAVAYVYAFCISDYFPSLVGLDLDGHETKVKEAADTMRRLHEPIINDRIQKWSNVGGDEKKQVEDFLDILISIKDDEGKPLLTPKEIIAESMEIMIAAVDNQSNAVEWILAEMQNNPQVLKKAMEELDNVVGTEKIVQESDIPKLNYLKACIRESFRLHPIAPFNVPHVATADTVVGGRYFIPKGSHVHLSRMGLGRNPKVWEEPLKFKPERHLVDSKDHDQEVVLTERDLRFISFSSGRRGCIAPALGTAMTVMLLARLLQGFTWTKPADIASINLVEGKYHMFLAQPLVLEAKPRLPVNLYKQL